MSSNGGTLSQDQIGRFHRDGFLKIEGFVTREACRRLMDRMGELVEAFDPAELGAVFSTVDRRQDADNYFLTSGDKIRFFLEEEAIDAAGHLVKAKDRCLNKVGHALHDLDPVFSAFSRMGGLGDIPGQLGQQDPRLIQSMYIFKQPHIGGEVIGHQDASFLITRPDSVIGLWFALEDATVENGCLYAYPGLHRGALRQLYRRRADGKGMEMIELDPTPLPQAGDPGLVPLEAPAGTLVVLHGRCPHLSGPNRSPKSRHAYAVHAIDGALPYPSFNWLQRDAGMPVRGFE